MAYTDCWPWNRADVYCNPHVCWGPFYLGSRRDCFELANPQREKSKDFVEISANSANFYISSSFGVPHLFSSANGLSRCTLGIIPISDVALEVELRCFPYFPRQYHIQDFPRFQKPILSNSWYLLPLVYSSLDLPSGAWMLPQTMEIRVRLRDWRKVSWKE